MIKMINRKSGFSNMFVLLLAVIIITGISCKKFIYDPPITTTYGSKFWVSERAVDQSTLAMYVQLRNGLKSSASHFIFGDLTTDVFHCAYNADWTLNAVKAGNNPPFFFSYVPYKEGVLQNWSRFYKLIAQCNLVLQNVPPMQNSLFSSRKKNEYVGEALFMRAYTYFYITRVWGDPVYVSQTYNDIDYGNIPPVPRSPEAAVLDSCLRDLRTASSYLGYVNGDPAQSTRANKGTVYSLMAHIFAWQHKYDSVHVYASKVINEGGYSLEPAATYSDIWAGQKSSESIFELPMMANDQSIIAETDVTGGKPGFFGVFLKGDIINRAGNNCWIVPTNGMTGVLFQDKNDMRFTTQLQPVAASNGDEAGYMFLKYSNVKYKNEQDKTSPYVNNNLVLLRLSDILLLDAEALASTGNIEGARSLVKQTEDRAGITGYTAPASAYDMLDEIVMERGRELMGEGCWYYDLIRTESAQGWLQYIGYPAARLTPDNKGYYWPLDMNALFPYDNLLTQNPWWLKNK